MYEMHLSVKIITIGYYPTHYRIHFKKLNCRLERLHDFVKVTLVVLKEQDLKENSVTTICVVSKRNKQINNKMPKFKKLS